MQRAGAITFDYGNNLRGQALEAGVTDAFDFPGFVPAYIRPLFCEGKGPFRWAVLSGDPADIARIDEDGYVFIVDRAKDMVLRGGENVYCSEVESAIYDHGGVAEAAVFGVPDDRLGEIVGAAIVPAPGVELDEAALREFLGSKLARFKIPERFWFLDDALPRNANGKFVKRELKETLLT